MRTQQLELSFDGALTLIPTGRRRRGRQARWWFDRMRSAVAQAWDWSAGPPPRSAPGSWGPGPASSPGPTPG